MLSHRVNRKNNTKYAFAIVSLFCSTLYATEPTTVHAKNTLSFEKAIKHAQKNDPWLTGSSHKQSAMESMSEAVNILPAPKVSLSFANLPVNGFDFSQEGMTQAKIGVAQMFPRGETLAIKSEQLKIQSEVFPFQRQDRKAKVAVTVGSIWLDAYRVQQSISLIENSRFLFEQLVDVAQASYSSAVGKTRQQDIVRAQLELTRLEERLDMLAQQQNRYQGMLLQWLTLLSDNSSTKEVTQFNNSSLHNMQLSQQLPQLELVSDNLVYQQSWLQPEKLIPYFKGHPSVIAIDKKVRASKTTIKLAKQKYQPEWGVNASYGYRGDDPMGRSRADLFSVGVTFDLPLFTKSKQDKELQSAISTTEAVKTEKLLLLRKLLGSYASAKGRLLRLKDRQELYKIKLLPQIQDQAEASLTAYTNDDGDFSEVVRSRIAVLNAEIDALIIDVEEQKILLEINYLLLGSKNNRHKTEISRNEMNLTNSGKYAAISGDK